MSTVPTSITPNTGNPLAVALSRVNVDSYCWGGTKPPCFDCSGFIYWCFNQVGIPLARPMFQQLSQGQNVVMGPQGNRLMNALPGDVVYFGLSNADPAKNHEGIISSTTGVGSMVNAECTACGPINIVPIGEGSSSEPISAIRRFTSTNIPAGPSTGGTGTTDASLLAADCKFSIPLINACIWHDSWGRALIGAAFIMGAMSLTTIAVVILTGKKVLKTAGISPQKIVQRGIVNAANNLGAPNVSN